MTFLTNWLTETWTMTLDAAPWLLIGFLLAGVVYILLPTEKVVAHLGRPGLGSVIKAALIGVPLPLCSCSVIPVASSLRQRGASRGATASFLISTPESGIDSIAISYALLGPLLAIVRPLAAFVSAALAGALIARGERHTHTAPEPGHPDSEASCGSCCCAETHTLKGSIFGRLRQALRYGFVDMFADLGHWLLLGFLLGGLVSALLPANFFERSIGSEWVAIVLMLIAGIPLYVCATSATPIAAALIAKGMGPGAALVFLLVGPATNMATMVVVGRDLGRTNLVRYLASIAVVAVLFGVGINLIGGEMAFTPGAFLADHCPGFIGQAAAIALVVLVLNGLRVKVARDMRNSGRLGAAGS